MKTFIQVISICWFMLISCTPENKPGEQTGTRIPDSMVLYNKFTQLADQWLTAYNERDTLVLGSLYAPDAEYISAHVDGYTAKGRQTVVQNFQKGVETGGYLDSIRILSIRTSEDLATMVTSYYGTAEGLKVSGRNLLVWDKTNGPWQIVTHMTVVRE